MPYQAKNESRNEEQGCARSEIANNAVERPTPCQGSLPRGMRFALVVEDRLTEGIHVAHRDLPFIPDVSLQIAVKHPRPGHNALRRRIIKYVYKNDRDYFSLFCHNHEQPF